MPRRAPADVDAVLKPVAAFRPPASLVDEIVRVLASQIVRGDLAAGFHLVEERIGAEFGVSRPAIREAFRILERNGLVDIFPRRGAKVTTMTADDVAGIYACRVALEGMAARLASTRISRRDLDRLSALTTEMARTADRRDLEAFFTANVEFHNILGDASGNVRLKQLLDVLGAQVLRMRHMSLSLPGRMIYSAKMHRRIVAAISARDAERAEVLTRELIDRASQALENPTTSELRRRKRTAADTG